jgi:hypothetical protein
MINALSDGGWFAYKELAAKLSPNALSSSHSGAERI